MVFKRLTITLDQEEREALTRLAQADVRPPKEQLRFLLRSEAEKRGLWPVPIPATRPATGTEVRSGQAA